MPLGRNQVLFHVGKNPPFYNMVIELQSPWRSDNKLEKVYFGLAIKLVPLVGMGFFPKLT
jgi:hypothetical protein